MNLHDWCRQQASFWLTPWHELHDPDTAVTPSEGSLPVPAHRDGFPASSGGVSPVAGSSHQPPRPTALGRVRLPGDRIIWHYDP